MIDNRLAKAQLMEQISQCEFVCIDLNLYLDTHPQDGNALEDYKCYTAQLLALKKEYVKRFGPLENFGNDMCEGDEWTWTSGRWPWVASYDCYKED